ncbi:MAG: type II secretion system protein [Candidatus Omnitrophota bacterium]
MTLPIGKNNHGFTLIELLAVILIISVLISLSIPTITKTARKFYFINKIKTIACLFKYVRNLAVLEQREYEAIIDSDANTLEIKRLDENEFTEKEFKAINDSILRARNLPDGFFIKMGNDDLKTKEIFFYPNGSLTSTDIYVYDKKNHAARITLTVSGQIVMEFL